MNEPVLTQPPENPYKNETFETFLQEIGNANLPSWSIIAEGLGVSRKTIERWRKHPLAQQAISNAISENLQKMEEAGKNDWKMYREKLKMLGVKEKQTIEHEADKFVSDVLDQLEVDNLKTDYGNLAKCAREELLARTQKEPSLVPSNLSQA